MGQQQLLLLVLVTVVVGFAIVAGIDAFQLGQRQSAINHMTQEAIDIADDVQEYAQRPDLSRPENETAGDSEDSDLVVGFSELQHYDTFDDGSEGDDYTDQVATYSLNGHSSLPDDYDESACPDDDPINTVEAYSERHDVSVCVSITGTSSHDLKAGVAK